MHSHGRFHRGNAKKTGVTLKDFKEYLYCYVIFIKSTVYEYCLTFSPVICTFLGEGGGGGAYWKGVLIKYFYPRRGAYSNGGAYLKLGTNLSIYGIWVTGNLQIIAYFC